MWILAGGKSGFKLYAVPANVRGETLSVQIVLGNKKKHTDDNQRSLQNTENRIKLHFQINNVMQDNTVGHAPACHGKAVWSLRLLLSYTQQLVALKLWLWFVRLLSGSSLLVKDGDKQNFKVHITSLLHVASSKSRDEVFLQVAF